MTSPHSYNSCEQVQSYFTLYPVPVAAALWCGIPAHQVNDHLKQANEVYRGVFALSYIKCLEPRCRAIHNAIDSAALPVCRERGIPVNDHVAPERRHVRREDLKAWIAKEFPDDKPAFLFDEIERKTHAAINIDTFRTLQADRDALKARIEKATEAYRNLIQECQAITSERDSLRKMVDDFTTKLQSTNVPSERSETTYQNIIAALLDYIAGNFPNVEKHQSFESEAKLIEAIDEHYRGYGGLSKSNLSRKFPEAKRNLLKR